MEFQSLFTLTCRCRIPFSFSKSSFFHLFFLSNKELYSMNQKSFFSTLKNKNAPVSEKQNACECLRGWNHSALSKDFKESFWKAATASAATFLKLLIHGRWAPPVCQFGLAPGPGGDLMLEVKGKCSSRWVCPTFSKLARNPCKVQRTEQMSSHCRQAINRSPASVITSTAAGEGFLCLHGAWKTMDCSVLFLISR